MKSGRVPVNIENGTQLAIAAVVRDEAATLIDWIAFHQTQGFEHFYIADNASVDGTTEILEALASIGLVTLIKIPEIQGPIQQIAYERLMNEVVPPDCLIAFIDADEYVTGHAGTPAGCTLRSVFEREEVVGVVINWRIFGTQGARFDAREPVNQRQIKCADPAFALHHLFKSVVRSQFISRPGPHMPEIHEGSGIFCTPSGDECEWGKDLFEKPGTRPTSLDFSKVTVHHHVLGSQENYWGKKASRRRVSRDGEWDEFPAESYLRLHDRNEDFCTAQFHFWNDQDLNQSAILNLLRRQSAIFSVAEIKLHDDAERVYVTVEFDEINTGLTIECEIRDKSGRYELIQQPLLQSKLMHITLQNFDIADIDGVRIRGCLDSRMNRTGGHHDT